MESRVIVTDRNRELVMQFTAQGRMTFERLRAMFGGTMRITHDLVHDRWFLELADARGTWW